jgi:hypothetical protein
MVRLLHSGVIRAGSRCPEKRRCERTSQLKDLVEHAVDVDLLDDVGIPVDCDQRR